MSVLTCTFCSNTLTKPLYEGKGKSFRIRSVESIIREMEYAKELCPSIKLVYDEVFPINKDWIRSLREVAHAGGPALRGPRPAHGSV